MAKSQDHGESWQRLDEIYAGSFFSFSKLNDEYIVAGLRGSAFVSKDGIKWQQLDTQTTASINDIQVINQKAILLANGGVWISYDGNSLNKVVTKEGKSLIAGTKSNNQLVIASEAGIQNLSVQ